MPNNSTELIQHDDTAAANWALLKGLAVASVSSPHSKLAYSRGLDDFYRWYATAGEAAPMFSRATVNSYRSHLETCGLAAATINQRLCAIRKLVSEASHNNLVDAGMANGIVHVKGLKRLGRRIGNWLPKREAEAFLAAPDTSTLRGLHDAALLSVLVTCGLRRAELCALTVEHIAQLEGRWTIKNLIGKGKRVRTVGMMPHTKVLIDSWLTAAGITSGFIFRPIDKSGKIVGERIRDPKTIWACVRKYADLAGLDIDRLAPHDLRRSFARLAYKGGAPLPDIQHALGHASIQTTELYIGTEDHWADCACDHLGIDVPLPRNPVPRAA